MRYGHNILPCVALCCSHFPAASHRGGGETRNLREEAAPVSTPASRDPRTSGGHRGPEARGRGDVPAQPREPSADTAAPTMAVTAAPARYR